MKCFEIDFERVKACVYRSEYNGYGGYFHPIVEFENLCLKSFLGIDEILQTLQNNTNNFLVGNDASNVLLWGARGCGKSSSIRAVLTHCLLADNPKSPSQEQNPQCLLRVIEIPKIGIEILPMTLDFVRSLPYKFIIFCDDLSFGAGDESYKALKSILDGGFEARASNVLFYATSNMRHLLLEEYAQDTLHLDDKKDEIIALSDRFGISMGLYSLGSEDFMRIVNSELSFNAGISDEALRQKALNYATQKGSRNARVAKEFAKLYKNHLI